MAGEKEPDGFELLLQPLGRRPWLAGGKHERGTGRIAEGEFQRAAGRHVVMPLRFAEHRVDRREGAGAGASKAPAAARLSSTRLFTARGLMRPANSARSRNGLSPRAATIDFTASRPTPLSAASA